MNQIIFTNGGWQSELWIEIQESATTLGIDINNPEIAALMKDVFDIYMKDEDTRSYHSLRYHIVPMIKRLVNRHSGPMARAIESVNTHFSDFNKLRPQFNVDPINTVSSGFSAPCDKKLNWELMFWAALFHDVYLDPRLLQGKNEANSASYWKKAAQVYYPSFGFVNIEMVSQMILATYKHEHHDLLIREFLKLDLDGFTKSFNEILTDELEIRKEYDWVDWNDYKEGRIKFLKAYADNSIIKELGVSNVLLQQAAYMEFVQPKICIFPGSFHFWHLGHHDVYTKLKKIFDKVIVVFAVNPDKPDNITNQNIPKILQNSQVEFVEGSLMAWVENLPYPVTIARGLRNGTDLLYEQTYIKWLQEFATKPFNVMAIFADPELEHLSSTALKNVQKLEPEKIDKYIYK